MTDTIAHGRLDEMTADIRRDPTRVRAHFPAAAREVGRGPATDEPDATPIRVEDQVRADLLAALADALAANHERLVEEVSCLYRYGDADEKRAVLLALHRLPVGAACLPVVEEALRTNDTRLVAAAMGPYGAVHLSAPAWRQGVLKCLFVGVPLSAVHDLAGRSDGELARMVAGYADERRAAGRIVPPDAALILGQPPRPRES
jgi:hypothetical protein